MSTNLTHFIANANKASKYVHLYPFLTVIGPKTYPKINKVRNPAYGIEIHPGTGFCQWLFPRLRLYAISFGLIKTWLFANLNIFLNKIPNNPKYKDIMQKPVILYIEDDKKQRESLSGKLYDRGFRVETAPDGKSGIEKLKSLNPDVIICDLHMPDMDGLKVLRQVRQISEDLPVLILTSHGTLSLALEAIKRGANHFIYKPVNIDDIEIHLHQAIEHNKMHRKLHEYSQGLEKMVAERTERIEYVNRQLAALSELSGKLTQIYSEDELLNRAPDFLTETLDFDRAACFLHENGDFELKSFCFKNDPPDIIERFKNNVIDRNIQLPPHFADCFNSRKTIFIDNLDSDSRWPKSPGRVVNAKSAVISPLNTKNGPIGILVGNLQYQHRELDDQDVARFEMFANMVGMAIDNIRVYQSLEKKVDERTRSLRIAYQELDDKAREAEQRRDQLQSIFDSSAAALIMVDKDENILVANRRLTDFFNLDASAINGRSLSELHDQINNDFENPEAHSRLLDHLRSMPDSIHEDHPQTELLYGRAVRITAPQERYLSLYSFPVLDASSQEIGRLWVYTDVTRLIKAEEQVRVIVESSPVPTLISRLEDGKLIYVNDHLLKLLGYSQEEVAGKSTTDFYADVSQREKVIKVLKEKGAVNDLAIQLKHKDGSTIWTMLSLALTSYRNETVIIGGLSDITQRKETEDALRRERNFINAVIDTAAALVVVLRPDGTILRFNQACEKISGYNASEVINRNFGDIFIVPEEQEILRERFDKIKQARGRVDGENYWLTKEGEKRLIAWSNNVMLDESGNVEYVIATGIDITDRRKAEEKQKLYHELFMNSKDGIVIVDREANYLESNPAYKQLTGYSDDDLVGRKIYDLMAVQDQMRFRESMRENGSFRGEMRAIRKGGEEFDVDVSVFKIEDEDGEFKNFAGIGRDVTEQKRAREALARRIWYEEGLAACSQALLTKADPQRAISEALLHLQIAARVTHVFILENYEDSEKGLSASLAYESIKEGEYVPSSRKALKIHYEPYLTRWKEILSDGDHIEGHISSFEPHEQEIMRSVTPVEYLVLLPITVGGEWYGVLGFEDCDDPGRTIDDEDIRLLRTGAEMIGGYIASKRFEESLRVSEERFRSLVENANDVIYSLKPDGTFSYLSPQFEKITGYDPGDFLDKPASALSHPDHVEEAREWVEQGMPLDHEHRFTGYQFRMQTRDGDYRWITTNTSVIRDEEGNPIEAIGIAHDVTEMIKLFEDLERTNRELVETQSQLVQTEKMASLGQLVAGIAHEINTPIGAVSSMHNSLVRAVEKLRQALESDLGEEYRKNPLLKKYIRVICDANRVIESGTDRVTTIVRRLRSFARLDEAELKTVNIHDGLEDTLTLIHHEIKHHITVNREYGDIPPIACYPGKLNQVFLNMLNNARQAIKDKGEIIIRTYQKDGHIILQFIDNGSGISKENLKRIFDPGFTTKGVGVGTGLGLSICFQIIRDHRGKIKVDSEPGKGTTFTIELPANLGKILEKEKQA